MVCILIPVMSEKLTVTFCLLKPLLGDVIDSLVITISGFESMLFINAKIPTKTKASAAIAMTQ